MGDYKRNDRRPSSGFGQRSGGRKSFGGGGSRFGGRNGGRDNGRPTMHEAICGECGDACEVPFRPTGERPVLCSDCFSKQGGGGRSSRPNRFNDRDRGRSNYGDSQGSNGSNSGDLTKRIDALTSKIDLLIESLGGKVSVKKEIEPRLKKEEKEKEAKDVKKAPAKKVAKGKKPAKTKKAPVKKIAKAKKPTKAKK